jgi:hypothetical protein
MDQEAKDSIVLVLFAAVSLGMIALTWATIASLFGVVTVTVLNLIPLGAAIQTFGRGVPGLSKRDVLLAYIVVGLMTVLAIAAFRAASVG